ncbi:MAG: hypothetical protein O2798_05655 [Chloroflexi bacterium]|nr:hypothetical protein [Chloroflexota bacterium]MDA1240316.1 hypothetical protein [Chloroflexota bacterium]MQC25775.1 hypothetical protein [Chloroflexota bacterium]MQC47781.1 hypothetical protein [Chloroflexota bacterium]
MDLLHLVDRLEELIAGAQKMPIGNRSILDRRRMLDLIDQMRVAVPHEVREAQDIVAQRDAVRRDAEEEGRLIVARAEERAARLIDANEITLAARQRADEIATEADRRLEYRIQEANRDIQQRIDESRRIAREQMQAADDYARELLERLDRQLTAFTRSIRAGIEQLEPPPAAPAGFAPMDDEGFAPEPQSPAYGVAAEATYRDDVEPQYGRETRYAEPASRYASEAYQPAYERDVEPARRDGDDEGLENLLRPARTAPSTGYVSPADPGVIDDFEHEPLDDDPFHGGRRGAR